MSVRPRLADVSCRRISFQPGDRVLVRTTHRLDQAQITQLCKTVKKWAGEDIEVLVYCALDMNLEIESHKHLVT